MPETVKYFAESDSREFFRLHSLFGRTLENTMSFLYGKTLIDFTTKETHSEEDRDYR